MMKAHESFKNILVSWIILVLLITFGSGLGYGDELIEKLFSAQNWSQLDTLFLDDSSTTLKDYFSASKSVKIMTSLENQMTYKVKFADMGEIGIITFEKKGDKYLNLKIKNQIRPLYFIEKFKKYRVANIHFNLGDAEIHLLSGVLYETIPFQSLLLFEGSWNFTVTPNDKEEQLTLKRKYRRDSFSQSSKSAIFVLKDKDFLSKLPADGETETLENDLQSLFLMYRDAYGVSIKQFEEYWYLPFADETNLVIFRQDKQSFYFYSYNTSLVPDTQLSESITNNMILSYNSVKGFKLSFGSADTVAKINLNLFLNPVTNFISGTSLILYKNTSTLRVFQLAEAISLIGNFNLEAKGVNIFQKKDNYYLMGLEADTLSLYFNGHIKPEPENFEIFNFQKTPGNINGIEKKEDDFYFLSRTDNYYPNPGNDFFKMELSVAIPSRLNCLASGELVNKKVMDETTVFKFSSPGTKGISLVVGDFLLRHKVKTSIPLHIYTPTSKRIPRYLDLGEIKKATDFFFHSFGPLDLPAIHLLLKPGIQEGGVSNNGFLIVNLPPEKNRNPLMISVPIIAPVIEKVLYSPVLIRSRSEDHIMHEMAHQWWGGVISWKSYHDIWITEGLAHFSVMYFLKKNLNDKKYLQLLKKIKRWVFKHSETGPIIYGTRINLLENSYEAYQSIIYNKSALVFLMLLDMMEEAEFLQRLHGVLAKFKYQSVSTMQFIREFCGENQQLLTFFQKWIYSRVLPMVTLKLVPEDAENDTKSLKKVVITIEQLNGDEPFIFPLQLKIVTGKGTFMQKVLMTEMKQRFVISMPHSIRSIDIGENATPFREKKQTNLPYIN